ncbi:hypothetical protein CRE_04373 [Caenorhabditis remanei]|uniref:Receptor L-domain domain-containing protein n=1 Tax=Caenorhabditis remanei TaxID=31234 RepID=E3NJE1_CAERE|nr:hypothetical protein CRE_04373 [Caenorhabditis remanei]
MYSSQPIIIKLPEFDVNMEQIIKDQAGGNGSFLREFVTENGKPKGIGNRPGFNDSYCRNIEEELIVHPKYADCIVLESLNENRSIVKLNAWSGFEIFKFAVNLKELKNIEVQLVYQNELTYLYFTEFRKCDNCLFNLTKNPALVGLRFHYLTETDDLNTIDKEYLPKLYIRGNSRLKFSHKQDYSKIKALRKICNEEMCVIQKNEECHFKNTIKSSKEYSNCRYVYGDMHFNYRFQESNPGDMNFKIDGCFVFNRTGIQYLRPILRAFTTCDREHIFEKNKYMCTDQLEELKRHWEPNKLKIDADPIKVRCYHGECRGGFISENVQARYSGCEVFRGDVYMSQESGNISERIHELSYAHKINGSFHVVNNTFITKLALPFLKKIDSAKCPALVIENMENLRDVIFHSSIEFKCNTTGPKVIIRNCSRLYLYKQTLRQMRQYGAVFEGFNSETDAYSENCTFFLLFGSLGVILIFEILWDLRRNLLLPNWTYRIFPMTIMRKPKQKQPRKKKPQ